MWIYIACTYSLYLWDYNIAATRHWWKGVSLILSFGVLNDFFRFSKKKWVFGYSWSTLLWYRCYYPHRSRDALSPVCRIFLYIRASTYSFFTNDVIVIPLTSVSSKSSLIVLLNWSQYLSHILIFWHFLTILKLKIISNLTIGNYVQIEPHNYFTFFRPPNKSHWLPPNEPCINIAIKFSHSLPTTKPIPPIPTHRVM